MTVDENSYFQQQTRSTQTNTPELTKLERVSADELALLQAYRLCDQQHRENSLQFILASSSRCAKKFANVVLLSDPQRKFR
jgi:hypothetical protein